MRGTRVVMDLAALRHNLARARRAAPNSRVLAAIKANGYGHGLVRAAHALAGADALGVACIDEAMELRAAGITAPITLLEGFFHADELPLIARDGFETVIHHPHQIDHLERARLNTPIPVWLKVDSGMHRLGFPPEAVQEAHRRLSACPSVAAVVGCMTHLARADERDAAATPRQLELFHRATEGLGGERSIANSAGLLGWPATHVDWVRPGVMLYGVSPFIGGRGADEELEPVMTFHSEIIAINRVKKGEAIGYGGSWICPEDMDVGVVAAGYGDGYPRHAPSGTPVLVNGRPLPLVGRVSMDMLTVDLRGMPEACIGDPVVLWGRGLPVEEIADRAGTIAYELLCGVAKRVEIAEEGAETLQPPRRQIAGS